MSATILDGKSIAAGLEAELAEEVADFVQNTAQQPTLAAVQPVPETSAWGRIGVRWHTRRRRWSPNHQSFPLRNLLRWFGLV